MPQLLQSSRLVTAVLAFAGLAAGLRADTTILAVRTGTIVDAGQGAPQPGAVILIEGDRIKAVGRDLVIPAGARVLDLSGFTVLPGFIDMHTHLTSPIVGEPNWEDSFARETAADFALRGALHARQALEAGYTTVREVGAAGFADVALRKAIDQGRVPGPRMFVSAHAIGITGGHCDAGGFAPNLFGHEPGIAEGIANGPDEVRAAVRYQAKYGADLIKICATGGVISVGDTAGAQQYNAAELAAAVETAHMLERKIAAHAHGTEGIKAAVRAGVDSIEHGSLLDDEGAKLMAERGTFLVSTLMAGDAVARMARDGRLTGDYAKKALAIGPFMPKAIARAAAAGVRIALGTDNIFDSHTTDAREFSLLVAAGLSPRDAIRAGTRTAALLLGREKDLGAIAPGFYADLVAVKGDPLVDIRRLEDVSVVIKGGVVVKDRRGEGR